MTTSISVPAARLRDMLAAVVPHACEDDTLPGIAGVRFEVRAGSLFLVATDRYSIGVARYRIPAADAAPEADALLPLKDARRGLTRMLKRAHGAAAVTFGDGSLTVDTSTGTAAYGLAVRMEFPSWRRILGGLLADDPAELGDGYGLNPVHMAKFAQSPDPGDDLAFCLSPLRLRIVRAAGSPVPVILVSRGDWFLGVMMPVRQEHTGRGEPEPAAWAEWAAVTSPQEKAEAA